MVGMNLPLVIKNIPLNSIIFTFRCYIIIFNLLFLMVTLNMVFKPSLKRFYLKGELNAHEILLRIS
jgi:hypothetical protein